jgi:hypothetical protein
MSSMLVCKARPCATSGSLAGATEVDPPASYYIYTDDYYRLRGRWLRKSQGHLCTGHDFWCWRTLGSQCYRWRLLRIRTHSPHRRLSIDCITEERSTATPHSWKWRLYCFLEDVQGNLMCCFHAEQPTRSSHAHRQRHPGMLPKVEARLHIFA